ncbi:MAG: class I SAM-dependent methyltransferase [Candidatus Woesearchaeota archaeon]
MANEESVKCNQCGADDYTVVFEKTESHHAVDLKDKYSAAKGVPCTDQVVKGNQCGLVYINPRTSEDVILESCADGDDEVYFSQAEGRISTFGSGLRWLERFAAKGKLLDVGCAAGFFLKVANESGWDVKGVEPNRWLGEQGRKNYGVDIFSGYFENAKFDDKSFNVATMWDVIEHIPKPKEALKEANRVLKDSGTLLVSTPDFSSVFAKMFGRNWWFFLSHHLFYFTPKTMENMLKDAGFEVVKTRMHFQTLEIGYMIKMVKHLSKGGVVSSLCSGALKVANAIRLSKVKIPYYASQIDIIAKKVR